MVTLPAGIVPIRDLSTLDVLYGARRSRIVYELLEHDPATGRDSLAGYLDGVDGGSIRWQSGVAVKKSLSMKVRDLAVAAPGRRRAADVDWAVTRVRPVLEVDGLPRMPRGSYVVVGAPERWAGTGRTIELELLDRTTVLDQDALDESFVADAGTPILEHVRTLCASAGEAIEVDTGDERAASTDLVLEVGMSKLAAVNTLLDVLGYNSLTVDAAGELVASPYVPPSSRPTRYAALTGDDGLPLPRELVDGDRAIYLPEWDRERDVWRVPNKVIAISAAGGEEPALVGVATNEDPASEFSYQRRGNRWVAHKIDGLELPDFSGEVDPEAAGVAWLEERAYRTLVAMSAVASVTIRCLPLPLDLLDVVRFVSTPAGIDALHVVTAIEQELRFDALMRVELREVVSL